MKTLIIVIIVIVLVAGTLIYNLNVFQSQIKNEPPQLVIIHGRDSGYLVPHWGKDSGYRYIQYRDKFGVWHTDSFRLVDFKIVSPPPSID